MPSAKVGHIVPPRGDGAPFACRPNRLEHAQGLRPWARERPPPVGGRSAGGPRLEIIAKT
eukprot:4251259-Lingulodinium_polyedra.AAC.1